GEFQQPLVGDAVPQEEREARRHFEIAQRITRRGCGATSRRWIAIYAQQEIRIHQRPLERELNASVKAALVASSTTEEVEQGARVGGGRRPAIGQAGDTSQNLRCAIALVRLPSWLTDEDRATARRVARRTLDVMPRRARDGVRPADRQRTHGSVAHVDLVVG